MAAIDYAPLFRWCSTTFRAEINAAYGLRLLGDGSIGADLTDNHPDKVARRAELLADTIKSENIAHGRDCWDQEIRNQSEAHTKLQRGMIERTMSNLVCIRRISRSHTIDMLLRPLDRTEGDNISDYERARAAVGLLWHIPPGQAVLKYGSGIWESENKCLCPSKCNEKSFLRKETSTEIQSFVAAHGNVA